MLLKSIARILIKYVGNAAGFGVAGDAIIDIWDLWSRYQQDQRQKLAEVQQLAAQPATEARRQAAEVAQEVAGDQPEAVRQALKAYLSQIPNSIRQSQRRPQDPSGRSVSALLRLQRPEDLLVLLPSRAPRFKVGDRPAGVGDWELEELLGMGGFGEVWKAKNPHMPHAERVALKFCLDPAAAKVLRNEAGVLDQVMRQGKHPGIVQLRHTYFSADVPCLEYEFVAGGDLTSLVYRQLQKNQGRLPMEMVAKIMRRIVGAVSYAHRLTPPIVHRDLKPANILVHLRPDGKGELRIADFGIGGVASACAIDQTPGQFLTTSVRGSCTPLYCSAQQARGDPPDPRDDVHALGVIWYQLLVGDLGQGAPTGTGWVKDLLSRGMAQEQIDLLASCFDSWPNRRPADAGVLADELDKLGPPAGGGGGGAGGNGGREAGKVPDPWGPTSKSNAAVNRVFREGPKDRLWRFKDLVEATRLTKKQVRYSHLREMVEAGFLVREGNSYRLRRPGGPPLTPCDGGAKIIGPVDIHGNRVGSDRAKTWSALTNDWQTMKEIIAKSGAKDTTYSFFCRLHEAGKIEKQTIKGRGKCFRLATGADAGLTSTNDSQTGRTGRKIMGHSPTSLIRWMGRDGWTAEQARKVIDRYGAADYGDGPLTQILKEGATGNMKWGPPADISEAQAEELRGVRDGKREPTAGLDV